ncbi:hypothetical protein J6590_052781 [Homalodisca vitripennis]|nr:hypothetical protein J6590_052781 [Homalodisca vitripennis]
MGQAKGSGMITSAGVTQRCRAGTVVAITSGGDQSRAVFSDRVRYLWGSTGDEIMVMSG